MKMLPPLLLASILLLLLLLLQSIFVANERKYKEK